MDISLKNYMEFIGGRYALGGMFHATIVSGTSNSDKSRIVTALAASILCSGKANKPCGTCPDCRKAFSGIHPDLIRLTLPEDKKEIPLNLIRDLRADASVIPNDSDNKVYVIEDGDKLSIEGQNVLLKTLEEPPAFSYFILCVENAGQLLPTVRSRCAELRCVSAEASGASDEALEIADKFIKLCIQNDKYAMMAHINSLGSTDRSVLAEAASEFRRLTAVRLAAESDPQCRQRLYKASETFREVCDYLDLNVGTVHILGFIMAELA